MVVMGGGDRRRVTEICYTLSCCNSACCSTISSFFGEGKEHSPTTFPIAGKGAWQLTPK